MWLLENEDIFKGRRLWLRPGATYLFGRTAAEPGQLAVSHNTISRKHLTITVAPVGEGQSQQVLTRSSLTIEDLATKIGTEVDGHKIKGSKYVVTESKAELMMGKCPSKFRIEWFPVVLTFSFTSKELQAQPLTSLRERFENLDIKLLTDYNPDHTTHVVSKKRNTAKGLQALIYGKYVVAESFLNALAQAAGPSIVDGVSEPSLLESDFGRHWPDALQHLPPRGGEPVQHPDAIYAPDPGRKDVFDGYTFIFYDKTQYNNLVAPITDGCGKAMLRTISPGEESAQDFVRYVKGVAGEKGLGSFDDGSEGRGVVLVRYLPGKGDMVGWYTEFITAVSLRLDHRPVEQNEFLEAILTRDASKLRRPLEVENSQPAPSATLAAAEPSPHARDIEVEPGPETTRDQPRQPNDEDGPEEPQPRALRRGANRRPVKKRFAGFDDGMDLDTEEASPADRPKQVPQPEPEEEEQESGLFVSQQPDISQTLEATYSTRKRKASPPPEDDLMDGMAPAAARFKRQRLQRGTVFASPSPEAAPPASTPVQTKKNQQTEKMDVLSLAGRHREEEEARARAERQDLAQLPDDIDLAEIRRLNIVEEMDVRRQQGRTCRTREQDIADGRWNPKWNGVRNFKKFRPRGEQQGRTPARVIVPLTQVKDKEFGIGDDYWLEDESTTTPQTKASAAPQPNPQQQQPMPEPDVVPVPVPVPAAAKQSQPSTSSRPRGKRPAPEASPQPRGGKRRRRKVAGGDVEGEGGNESDDELKFRFGRRR
ncbi:DNA damage response protein RcaA [Ophiocordyceps camponoti-floridani]|uniref:DNA damage response protein RcaA n=1 Tax=Ophiocordyceps camponoti-floridani TaxID=2030778 RepID=A0A8H4QA89_9HYPO|nr:DNA damage response protein RcaA [Ophiocordyceps camponoti-floridani]